MKIWVIGRNYPLPENQMKGSFELEQAKMLAKKDNIEVSYLSASLHPTKTINQKGFQKWVEDNVTIFTYSQLFFPRIYPFYFGKIRNKVWFNFFEKVAAETGLPDVIHLHYPVMMLLADVLLIYKKQGVKIIVTEHWTKVLAQKLDSYELKQLKKYVEVSDSFICVGAPLKKAISEMTKVDDSLTVVPNVVNAAFMPVLKNHETFNFISVGRLVKIKQFDLIVKAFATIFKNIPDTTLTIVGDGDEKKALEKLIIDLDVKDQVYLTGSLCRNETAKKVAESDCLICYSTFETFGVPVIEAWACGIPAIFSTACSVSNSIDDRLGIEVSPYRLSELESAMKYVFEHINLYNKKFIADFSKCNYSENVISDRLIEIYK